MGIFPFSFKNYSENCFWWGIVKKLVNAMYVLNIIAQAIFDLALPIGFGVLGSWLLVRYASAPGWVYAPLVVLGAVIGFYTMIKFVLSAMAALERLEKEQNSNKTSGEANEKE